MPIRTLLLLACGMPGAVSGVCAQSHPLSVAFEAGLVRFRGTTAPAPGMDVSPVRPDQSVEFAVRVVRRAAIVSLGLGLRYTEAQSLIVEGDPFPVILPGLSLRAYDLAPEVGLRIVSGRGNRSLSIYAGPLLTRWTAEGSDARTRVGAHAALALDLPFNERIAGTLRTGLSVSGSLFSEEEVAPELRRRATWRRTFGLGVQYRL